MPSKYTVVKNYIAYKFHIVQTFEKFPESYEVDLNSVSKNSAFDKILKTRKLRLKKYNITSTT